MNRPDNLHGDWGPTDPDEHGYTSWHAGPVEVRYHDGYEPDGELVTRGPVAAVHIEQMDKGYWSVILNTADGEVHVNFVSKGRIKVLWREER